MSDTDWKFKEGASISTDNFWYDLTDGGYIKPEKLLEADDAKILRAAIDIIESFKSAAESKGILEYN
jgi:hypothetical protein